MPPNNSIGEASKNQSATDSSTRPTLDKLRDIIATDDVAINFYGVVVDSESKPLENVEVEWELIKAGAFAPSLGFPSWGQGTVKTNSKGEFSILNEKGKTISIKSFKFSGYHSLMREPRAFGYRNAAPHQPDSAKPVRFVMVKDGGKRSEKYDVRLNFDWDGKVKKINIGKKDSLPEIQLIPTRLPVESGNFRYDWKLVIQVEEGGICKGINDGNSVAPESGYVKEVVVQADKNGLWFNNVEALIYFKTEAQEFFELRISAHADRGIDDVTGRISVRRNTEGGRIFE